MKKKYLKTVKDVLALKDTDTKIYDVCTDTGHYYQFVNGVLCRFFDNADKEVWYNTYIPIGRNSEFYILEEAPEQEATEKDVGKLCWFKDNNGDEFVAILDDYNKSFELPCECSSGWYEHCRPLTKEEIKKFMEKAE